MFPVHSAKEYILLVIAKEGNKKFQLILGATSVPVAQ
jgi:hypothetical protein